MPFEIPAPTQAGPVVWQESAAAFRKRRWLSGWTYAFLLGAAGLGMVTWLWSRKVLPWFGFLIFGIAFAATLAFALWVWRQQTPVRVHTHGISLGFWPAQVLDISQIEAFETTAPGPKGDALIIVTSTQGLQYRFGNDYDAAVRIKETAGFLQAMEKVGVRRLEHHRKWDPRAEVAVRSIGEGMFAIMVAAEATAVANGIEVITPSFLKERIATITATVPQAAKKLTDALGSS